MEIADVMDMSCRDAKKGAEAILKLVEAICDMDGYWLPPCEGSQGDCYICPFVGRELSQQECWVSWATRYTVK